MKKISVLSAVSAAALLGISGVALAQSTGASPGSSSTPPGSTMQRQDAPPSGGAPNAMKNAPSRMDDSGSATGDRLSPSQAQGAPSGKDAQKSNQAQERAPADSKSKMGGDGKSGATVGAAPAGAVNLTTEQRAEIRQNVLTQSAPRATNINFALNVGTVVPGSVRVVEVPPTIVKIHPQWRGFRYFVVNDEIVIVEPRTLKIVAVLNV